MKRKESALLCSPPLRGKEGCAQQELWSGLNTNAGDPRSQPSNSVPTTTWEWLAATVPSMEQSKSRQQVHHEAPWTSFSLLPSPNTSLPLSQQKSHKNTHSQPPPHKKHYSPSKNIFKDTHPLLSTQQPSLTTSTKLIEC